MPDLLPTVKPNFFHILNLGHELIPAPQTKNLLPIFWIPWGFYSLFSIPPLYLVLIKPILEFMRHWTIQIPNSLFGTQMHFDNYN